MFVAMNLGSADRVKLIWKDWTSQPTTLYTTILCKTDQDMKSTKCYILYHYVFWEMISTVA